MILPLFPPRANVLPATAFVFFLLTAGAAGAAPGHDGGHADAGHATADHASRGEGVHLLNGADTYRQRCVACHGDEGDGRGSDVRTLNRKVPDFTAASAVVDYSPAAMRKALGRGHEVDTAPYWTTPLTDREVDEVVAYIQDAYMRPSVTADASTGRGIFARSCSVCHGEKGDGASWTKGSLNPPPFDFTSYKAKKLSRRHMINTVTYGRQGTAMVGFATQLSATEVAAVVDYIRRTFIYPNDPKLSQKRDTPAGKIPVSGNSAAAHHGTPPPAPHDDHAPGQSADMAAPMPASLTGDPARGEALYKVNCVACHGETGKGDGPRAYFIFPKPENFTDARARAELNRPHLFEGISYGVEGTVMPAWSKVLEPQDIADIAEYVMQSFIRPDGPVRAAVELPAGDGEPDAAKKN